MDHGDHEAGTQLGTCDRCWTNRNIVSAATTTPYDVIEDDIEEPDNIWDDKEELEYLALCEKWGINPWWAFSGYDDLEDDYSEDSFP